MEEGQGGMGKWSRCAEWRGRGMARDGCGTGRPACVKHAAMRGDSEGMQAESASRIQADVYIHELHPSGTRMADIHVREELCVREG
jgi:hypothetical protein